jgi:maltose/moltooligosaccharide transporter
MEMFQSDKEKTESVSEVSIKAEYYFKNGSIWLATGLILYFVFAEFIYIDYGLAVFFLGLATFGILQIIAGYLTKNKQVKNGYVVVINDLFNMPKTMKQLAVVQFFSWFALFAMWIYTTPAVTHHIYGTTDTTSSLYNQGADWVGVLMAVYNGFAAIMAFAIMWAARRMGRKTVHAISLIAGGLGLLSFYFITNPNLLLVSELGIGLAWASILAMPYAILTGALPQKKLGVYMGIFNFFIVIPQITAAAILGFFVRDLFGGEAIYALLLGGISFFISAFLMKFVNDNN